MNSDEVNWLLQTIEEPENAKRFVQAQYQRGRIPPHMMASLAQNRNRYKRIANQTLMLPNTFLAPARHDDRSPELNISATQVLLAMATGLFLAGPLVWMFVRYWLFGL